MPFVDPLAPLPAAASASSLWLQMPPDWEVETPVTSPSTRHRPMLHAGLNHRHSWHIWGRLRSRLGLHKTTEYFRRFSPICADSRSKPPIPALNRRIPPIGAFFGPADFRRNPPTSAASRRFALRARSFGNSASEPLPMEKGSSLHTRRHGRTPNSVVQHVVHSLLKDCQTGLPV